MKEKVLNFMKNHGWRIEVTKENTRNLPDEIQRRYPNISPQWHDFIRGLDVLMNQEETTWLLCFKDFYGQGDYAFQWNEWEKMSLDSADDDVEWQEEIRRFWNLHFPVVMSVKDGYAYYAISMDDGAIVYGYDPEFEECETVAASFEDFLEKIVDGSIKL